MISPDFRRHIVWAVAAGVLLRIALMTALVYPLHLGEGTVLDALTRNLVEHGTYSTDLGPPFAPTARWCPLVPLVASIFFRLFGETTLPFILAQALAGLMAAVSIALAMRSVAPAAAKAALWFTCLSPFDAVWATRLMGEALASAFLCVGMALTLASRKPWAWLLGGICLGLAALGRDPLLLVVPAACVAAIALPMFRVGWMGPCLLFVGAAAAIGPWTYRNCTETPTCAVISAGRLGPNLWVGTWERDISWEPPFRPRLDWPDEAFDSEKERRDLSGLDAEEAPSLNGRVRGQLRQDGLDGDEFLEANAKAFLRYALEHIKSHPWRVLGRWLQRLPKMWIGTRTEIVVFRSPALAQRRAGWFVVKASCYLLNAGWLALAAAGIVLAYRNAPRLLWFALPILTTVVGYLPFHNTEMRYSQPVYPLVLAFSAVGFVTWKSKVAGYLRSDGARAVARKARPVQ